MIEHLAQAAQQVFLDGQVWLVIVAAALFGTFVGAIPGLTATMAVALFVPMAYWLDPVAAMAGMVTMVACAIFAGDIPAVLLRIPGTPASAAFASEAYQLGRAHGARRLLSLMLACSVIGSFLGAVVLVAIGHQLAYVAAWFSVAEYFWLYLLGLCCAVLVAKDRPGVAVLALLTGVALSTVGLSAVHGQARFTFGRPELAQGVGFIPAMIGLFGLSEVLNNLVGGKRDEQSAAATGAAAGDGNGLLRISSLLERKRDAVRSGVIGAGVGMLPGAGADMGAWVAMASSGRGKRAASASKEQRDTNMISDAAVAKSASLAGAWIPALVFGIPGDSVTAIVIGVLMMKNITPGPSIFAEQAPLVYGIYLLFVAASLVLIPVGLAAIWCGGWVVRVPQRVLMPLIAVFCVVGSYAINGSYFDVAVMLVLGALGFVYERFSIPLAPVVLGIILGGPLEERFIQTLSGADGSLLGFVDRPGSAVLAAVFAAIWLWPLLRRAMARGK